MFADNRNNGEQVFQYLCPCLATNMNVVGELWILKCQNGFHVQNEVVILVCSSVPLQKKATVRTEFIMKTKI